MGLCCFDPGFLGGYLGIDAPGNQGREGIQKHIEKSHVAEVRRENRQGQQQREAGKPGVSAHKAAQVQIPDGIKVH